MKTKAPRNTAILAAAAATVLGTGTARAQTFGYCDFSNVGSLTLNGTAVQSTNILSLTSTAESMSGSAFETAPIAWDSTTSFSTSFQFELTPSSLDGEGISFILQGDDVTALGLAQGGIGYGAKSATTGGITPSVAIEFDTYLDTWDPNDNHVAINEGGDDTNHIAYASPSFDMLGTGVVYAWIDYDAPSTTLDIYVAQAAGKPSMPLLTQTIDLASLVGPSVFVGFTGATGREVAEEDIDAWEFSTDGEPCVCGGNADCSGQEVCSTTTNVCSVPVMAVDAGPPAVDAASPDTGTPPPPADDAGATADASPPPPPVVDSGTPDTGTPPPPPAVDSGTYVSPPPAIDAGVTASVDDEGYDVAGGTCAARAPGAPVGQGAGLFGAFGLALAWIARRRRTR